MTKFVLEPNTVSAKAGVIGRLANDLNDLSSKVAGYDISDCEDFDFASAVSSISKNLTAAADKMANTQALLAAVVYGHTNLQSSLQYNPEDSSYASYGKPDSSSGSEDADDTSATPNYVNPGAAIPAAASAAVVTGSTSGGTSSPTYSSGDSSGGTIVVGTPTYVSPGSSETPSGGQTQIGSDTPTGGQPTTGGENPTGGSTPVDGKTPPESSTPIDDETPTEGQTPSEGDIPTEEETPTDVETPDEDVLETIEIPENMGNRHGVISWQDVTGETDPKAFKLQTLSGMTFNSGGFAEINSRYVVSCSETFGKVGDYVDFVKEDGTVIKCIIGQTIPVTDESTKYGNDNGEIIIHFFVDKLSWSEDHPAPGSENYYSEWNQFIIKANRVGSYYDENNDEGVENASSE